jgi:hypothetical protein
MQTAFQTAMPDVAPPMEPGDERLFVQFYLGSIKNEEKTLAEGRPIFDAVPFVKIVVPGDKSTIIDTLADATHKRRFARMWSNFQQSLSQEISGMPLRDWAAITRSQAEELVHMNVFTVEQLATLADVYGAKIMGFNELRRKAQAYIEQAKDTAFAQRMTKENQELRDEIAANKAELARLSEMFDRMQAGQPAKGQDANNSTRARANRSG